MPEATGELPRQRADALSRNVPGPLGLSLAGRALEAGTWSLEPVQIRDFAADRHRTVDDTPAGGGAGMVMRADVLARAIDQVSPPDDARPRLLMSPRGRPLTQARVRELAAGPRRGHRLRPLRGRRPARHRGARPRGSFDRRLHPVGRRTGRAGAARRGRAAAAGRDGQRRLRHRRELRGRPARTSALHAAAGIRRPADPGGADLRQPRQDRGLAPRGVRAADPRAPARPAAPLSPWRNSRPPGRSRPRRRSRARHSPARAWPPRSRHSRRAQQPGS